jgi:hypothetical protein
MVEKKSGPVKHPIIDAKPRTSATSASARKAPETTAASPQTPDPADAPKPAVEKAPADKPAAPEASKDAPAPKSGPTGPETPRPAASSTTPPPAPQSLPLGPLLAATVGGALIGLALAYGLASFGLWPQSGEDPVLAALESRTAQLEAGLSERDGETAEFETRLEELQSQLSAFDAPELVSTEGLAAQADLETLTSRISDLSSRVEAIAAGASGEDATEMAQSLSGLTSQIDTLTQRLDAVEPQVAETAPALQSAMTRLDDLDARIADQSDFEAVSSDRDRVAQLPAALAALETTIASGQPFSTQLAQLETLLPALQIPDETRAAAASGVTPAPDLLARFRATIPAMLAAVPPDPQANWAQTLLDQAASTLALRPTDGDSPQGLVGRTEAALAAGDLAAAQTAFAALPQPMQAAAPGFDRELARAQSAQALLETVRSADPVAEAAQ